ncbi:MAG: NAD(P)-binding domain-containing protein [Porticoccaceae bacterium]|nr:NAD(P)-binding domain-containing protein [Porticoccaceae bacterium]
MANLGFIGTGVMGEPMARNLLAAGHALYVHDALVTNMAALVADGAVACCNAAEIARHCHMIFLMVLDAEQIETVVFGDGGLVEELTAEHTLVCMSSVPAAYMRDLARRVGKVAVLDAPVSGGKAGAAVAELAIMVGGDPRDFERMKPFLKLMGSNITRVGELGSGQTAKAANQIIVSITRAAVGEAMLFAARDGADPEQVRQALKGGLADSATLETYGARISSLENPVRFDSPILKKDVNNVVAAARELNIHLPVTSLVRDSYNEWVEN